MVGTLGWEGPPFDVSALASYCGFDVRYADGFAPTQDACITPGRITVNRAKPRRRQRYSVSHEIVHTLIPGYREALDTGGPLWRDEAQAATADAAEIELEHLCQVGAAELLLPYFAFSPDLLALGLSLGTVIALGERYDASTEATARRAVDLSAEPAAVTFLVPHDRDGRVYPPGDYTPYAELRVARNYPNSAFATAACALGEIPPKSSIVRKAWKRASYRALACDVYAAEECWEKSGAGASQAVHVEAMVLPHRATAPAEVLMLVRPATSL